MRRLLPLLILFLGALALYIDFWPGPSGPGSGAQFMFLSDPNGGFNHQLETNLGLDLRGGFSITYQTINADGTVATPSSSEMSVIRSIVENRVNSTGVSEPIVETAGSNEIIVQVPGAVDKSAIEALVGQTGNLEFVLLPSPPYPKFDPTVGSDSGGTISLPVQGDPIDPSLPVQFYGKQLDSGSIQAALNTQTGATPGSWLINFAFAGQAANDFGTWSASHIDEHFAIVLDGKVQSAPYIASAITGGKGQISGSFTKADAQELATILQYGALPYPIKEIASTDIPASLGQTFLNQTLLAGAVGIGLVMFFMLIYYRLPGLIACLALAYYGVAVLALFRIVPVTLTLAGIAGFVLSVGMAVDANILIFERTKEELRTGKTLASAVEAGFNRAWNSILDSNVSSLITASILFLGGSSTIKGFALVLIIGVATSMFTAVTVSRTLLRVVVIQQSAHRAWLYGVTDEEFQARATGSRFSRREARGRV